MGKASHDDELKEIELHMVKVGTIEDLCRGACKFSEKYPDTLFSFRSDGRDVLARLTHHIDKVLLVNYVEMPYKSPLIKYTVQPREDEKVEFVDKIGMPQQGVCYIDVVRAGLSAIKAVKTVKKDTVINIETGSAYELVKSLISKHMHSADMPAVYSFTRKGKRYIAAFDVFMDLTYEKCLLYYAKSDEKSEFNFIKYSYETNSLSYTKWFEGQESGNAYVKVMHLKEPFQFFTS